MNKLMGFLELKELRIPTIPWKEYTVNTRLDKNVLWTVRTAVYRGEDLNLPRKVGVLAQEAENFAEDMKKKLGNKGMVIYYPFFVAEKSGNLNFFSDRIVIEAVKNDLWNLVTYSEREETIIITSEKTIRDGNEKFISKKEEEELCSYVPYLRNRFRDELLNNKSILLEWSYAYACDVNKNRIGDRYLVFYEIRTV